MREDIKLLNLIREIAIGAGFDNPHALARQSGITYRIVKRLYDAPYVKPTTSIGTLDTLALTLGVKVDDLYKREFIKGIE